MKTRKELSDQYDMTSLQEGFDQYSVKLDEKQISQFLKYYELLVEWNSFMNLTGITEYEDVVRKHFTDSISLTGYLDLSDMNTLIDVGTGAGFPGIPLKIVFPHLQVTLLDSLHKRIRFLDEVIQELELSGIRTIHGRAEDFARPGSDSLRESYDVCVSRAVANLPTLCEYCVPFIRIGGVFAAYKSEKSSEELLCARKAVKVLGGEVKEKVDFILPGSDLHRTIILISKNQKTPKAYPRKAGLPAKEPL